MSTIVERAFLHGCCIESRNINIDKSGLVLTLNLSHWINHVEKDALEEEINQYGSVSFTLDSVQALTKDEIFWISKVVGPRLSEIKVIDCKFLNEKIFKKLIEHGQSIRRIVLCRNTWVNDSLIESLVLRLCKTIVDIELENVKVTDISMFQVGRLCKELRSFSLIHCKGVTDDGLLELAKRAHLSRIRICHNMGVTDKGIKKLLATTKGLKVLDLLNCPKITSEPLISLYDTALAWGSQRSEKAAPLETLSLRGNVNLTPDIFLHVGLNSLNLLELDLRDCHDLELLGACKNLERLQNLQSLKLGPCTVQYDPDDLVDAILVFTENLTTLHLYEMDIFEDTHVAELLENSTELDEFLVSDVHVGVKTVEALCSYLPNLQKLAIHNSNNINDKEVRCIAASLPTIKELTIAGCRQITDEAFSRCSHLHLTRIDISRCPSKLDGHLLSCFSNSPLKYISLDDNSLSYQNDGENETSSYWTSCHIRIKLSVRKISLRNNMELVPKDVLDILHHFPFCEEIDLTGCIQLQKSLKTMAHHHPLLLFVSNKNFLGYKTNEQTINLSHKTQDMLTQTRKERAVRQIYRVYLKYLESCRQTLREEAAHAHAIKVYLVTKLQSVARMYITRKKNWPKVLAGRVIVKYSRLYLQHCSFYKVVVADKYRKMFVKAAMWKVLHAYAKNSKAKMEARLASHVVPRFLKRIKARYFALMIEKQFEQRDLKVMECAEAVYEMRFLGKIIDGWKSILSTETHNHRQQFLVNLFLVVVPLTHQNSFRQRSNLAMCDPFIEKRSILPGWFAFKDDYVRTKKAELLIPMAIAHHRTNLLHRVVAVTYKAVLDYKNERQWKKAQCVKGDERVLVWRKLLGVRYFGVNKRTKIRAIHGTEIADRFRNRFPLRSVTAKFQKAVLHSKMEKRGDKIAVFTFKNSQFQKLKRCVVKRKKWNVMCALAMFTYEVNTYNWVMKGWKRVTVYCRNLDEFMWGKYLTRLQKKAFSVFKDDLKEAKLFRASLGEDVQGLEEEEDAELAPVLDADGEVVHKEDMTPAQLKEREEEKAKIKAEKKKQFELMIKRMVTTQAQIRGFLARKQFKVKTIDTEWATGVLQKFGRSLLAYRRFALLRKRWLMTERKKEEVELDAMRDAEILIFICKPLSTFSAAFEGGKAVNLPMPSLALLQKFVMQYFMKKW